MSSSVCALISLDLFHSGIVKTNLKSEYLKQYSNKDSLYSSDWLISYEAGKRGWLKNTNVDYISKDDFFGALYKENVSFYDESSQCKPIFQFKPGDMLAIDLKSFFDMDKEIESHFDFGDMDEEYFDSSDSDEDDELDLGDEDFGFEE